MTTLSTELRYLRQHGPVAYVLDTLADARSAGLYWLWLAGVPALLVSELEVVDEAIGAMCYELKTPWYNLVRYCPIEALTLLNLICARRNFD